MDQQKISDTIAKTFLEDSKKLSTDKSALKDFEDWLERLHAFLSKESPQLEFETFTGFIRQSYTASTLHQLMTSTLSSEPEPQDADVALHLSLLLEHYEKFEDPIPDTDAKKIKYNKELYRRHLHTSQQAIAHIRQRLVMSEWKLIPKFNEMITDKTTSPYDLINLIKTTIYQNIHTSYLSIETKMRTFKQTYHNNKLKKTQILTLEKYLKNKIQLIVLDMT